MKEPRLLNRWGLGLLFIIGLVLHSCVGFNLDFKQSRIHRSAPNSGFGYSIAFYHFGNEDL
jgi:hypothetical protein